jgi:hypothetical protein
MWINIFVGTFLFITFLKLNKSSLNIYLQFEIKIFKIDWAVKSYEQKRKRMQLPRKK